MNLDQLSKRQSLARGLKQQEEPPLDEDSHLSTNMIEQYHNHNQNINNSNKNKDFSSEKN